MNNVILAAVTAAAKKLYPIDDATIIAVTTRPPDLWFARIPGKPLRERIVPDYAISARGGVYLVGYGRESNTLLVSNRIPTVDAQGFRQIKA